MTTMTNLTGEYLEGLGFSLSWSKDHNFRAEYSKYNSDVTAAIHLVSQTNAVKALNGELDLVFDVWFFGQTLKGSYDEIDSHMSVSFVEELDTILKLLHWEE